MVPARTRTACALAWALLVASGARAQVTVALELPAGPLPAGEPYLLKPVVTGAGDRPRCHWAVAEDRRLVGPRDGVRLEPGPDGCVLLAVDGRGAPRDLQVRATSVKDPSAFAWIEVRVRAGAAPEQAPPAPAQAGPAGCASHLWETPFTRTGTGTRPAAVFTAMAWDLSGPVPAVAAIVRHGQEYKVVRIGLDGREELLALGPHEWLPLACGRGGIAVRANGDVVLADSDNHRILLIPRHPPVETLAGRRPSPLDPGRWTGLELNFPCGIAATAGGDIVFADRGNHLVRRITPDGRLETLAGTLHLLGNVSREVRNDLRRIHPATATALWSPEGVAAAPDGRIVFVDGRPAVFELHPDGTLRRLDREGSLRRLDEDPTVVHGVTVTADNQVVCVAADNRVCRIAPDGGLVPLAGAGPAGSGPGTEAWALPAPGGGIRFPALLGVAAGPGGVLAYAPGPEAWFVGPEKGDDHLAGRVRTAVAAALEQRLDQAGPVRASLDTWAKACPPSADAVAGLRLGTLACGGLPVLGGVKALERLVCAYLREDHRGHWVRARVALGTLDREVRRRSPEAADQLAAWTPST